MVFVVLKGPRRGLPLSAEGLNEILDGARRRAGPGVGMRVAGDAFLIAGLCGVLEDCGHVVNGVEVSGGDVHY